MFGEVKIKKLKIWQIRSRIKLTTNLNLFLELLTRSIGKWNENMLKFLCFVCVR